MRTLLYGTLLHIIIYHTLLYCILSFTSGSVICVHLHGHQAISERLSSTAALLSSLNASLRQTCQILEIQSFWQVGVMYSNVRDC
jgi:hypothetical protein